MARLEKNGALRVLLSGDLHLGRSSSRVPESVGANELSVAAAWDRLVQYAIQSGVHLVCLSGDVADQDNKFWEAIGPLERGIQRLAAEDIRTVVVSGNHDYDVLERLAAQLPAEHFTLLGRGGTWERLTIEASGKTLLHIDGWSFAQQYVQDSPLHNYELESDPNVPILGMVHGDLDVADSRYAPLELARLQGLPPAGWLLGHIHAPRLYDGTPWVLYPGSPQALDPGETGAHGVWLVEVSNGRLTVPEMQPLSSVWYGQQTIDLSNMENEVALENTLYDEIRSEADQIAAIAGPNLVCASLRLQLVGATAVSHRVEEVAERVRNELSLFVGNSVVDVEKVETQTVPPIDLVQYAESHSAPGAVARLLLELEEENVSDEVSLLIQQTQQELEQVERQKEFVPLDRRGMTKEATREYLRKQGRALLTQLVSQTA